MSQHGEFIWYELITTDPDAAEAFYCKILNWSARDSGYPEMDYRLISANTDVAGLMKMPDEACSAGMRPAWMGYILVNDVDDSIDAILAAGGQVQMPATDIPGVGRIAMLSDPQGAYFYIMSAADNDIQSIDQSRLGQCCWNELSTTDQNAALDFYQKEFGWQKGEGMDMDGQGVYQLMHYAGKQENMGLGAIVDVMQEGMPPFWTFYFNVDDIDRAAEQIPSLGGQITMGPHEVPGDMFILLGIDPQGALFALIGPRK
jgi:hypothetical protein